MKESIKKSEDLNNELGVAFEKHSGILISKILKKEDSTYFNLKFSVARAIALIKQDLIKELFKGGKKEYDVYVKINDLVLICDKYLNEVKNTSDMPSNSNNKDCETDSSEFKKKIPNIQKKYCSAKQNKCQTKVNFSSNNSSISCKKDLNSSINISHINSGSNSDKNDFLKSNIISDEIIENKEQNPTKNKNKAKKEETDINKITSSELEEHEEGDTTSIISKKRKSNNELNGEIDIIIADVTKKDFEKLIKEEDNKYYLTNKKANLPDKFNIIIEACVNLGTQTIEKKKQINKYSILSRLINELYSKNKEYVDIYLSPFKKQNKNILSCPYFVFIIATNSSYDYFMTSAKKFLEDEKKKYDYDLFIFYINFKLNEVNDLEKNNKDFEKELEDLKATVNLLKAEIENLKKNNNKNNNNMEKFS